MIKNLISRTTLNIVLVSMIFIGLFTYDRNIEFSKYSDIQYGLLLFSKFSGYFISNFIFHQIANKMEIFTIFIISAVLFCQGGILFWVFDSFILKMLAYHIIGLSFSLINLSTINLLKEVNVNSFRTSIISVANMISFFFTLIPQQKQIFLTLFVSISTIIPYVIKPQVTLQKKQIVESNINITIIKICFIYYGKALWNIIFTYISDALFIMFFVKRLRLIYSNNNDYLFMYFISVMIIRISLHYPVQMLLKKFSPNTKSIIVASITLVMSIVQVIFYQNTIINLIANCCIGLFGSFFPFAIEYLEKHKNIRHSFLPTTLILNIIYGIVLLLVIPIGVYINALNPNIGVNYIILVINFAIIINSLI